MSPTIHRGKLEESRDALAIVQDGLFLYANARFLARLGCASLEDLQAIPLLDLVAPVHRTRAREHLAAARQVREDSQGRLQARLTLTRLDGTPLNAMLLSHGLRFEDEEAVRVVLRTAEDYGVWNRLRGLPWRFYLSLGLLALLLVVPPALLLKLDINNAPRVYFPEDEPAVLIDDELRRAFPSDQVIVLLFEGVALFSDGFLTAFHGLADTIAGHELVDDVLSVTRQDHIAGSEEGFTVAPLLDVRELERTRESDRPAIALGDRFARGTLVARDASALGMVVVPKPLDNSLQRMALEQFVLEAVEKARLSGYLTARAGMIPLDVAELQSMLRDNMTFIPATSAIGLLLIWWLFRRWLAVLLGGLAMGVVVSSTLAFYVIANQPFTLVSSLLPPLLSALTVSALIHLFNGVHFAAQRGFTGSARIEQAVREIRRPVLFNVLTTAAGLASLGTSPVRPVAVFGLISAVGVLLTYVLIVQVLPVLLRRWDRAGWPTTAGGLRLMDRLVGGLYRFGVRRPVLTLVSLGVILAASIPWLFQVRAETNLQEFFKPEHPIRRDTDRVQQVLTGTTSLELVLRAEAVDGLKTPAALGFMRAFQAWVEAQPEVDRSISPADFIEEMHWAFHAEASEARRIPEDANLIAQYLLVYDGKDLYKFIDRDFRFAHVQVSAHVHPANEISALMDRMRDWLAVHAPPDIQWEIGGSGRLFADMEDRLVTGQTYSIWAALVMIFVLLAILWRSLGQAIITMIPNLAPILFIFALMGMVGIWLDMGTVLIASVAVGVAVDDSIHLFHGFRERLRRGLAPAAALARTYHQSGRAVTTTTIVLSAQFGILVFSQFVPTENFGLLTSVGLVVALLFDLLALPALLMLIYRRRQPDKTA